ncbi:MAG: hypothetical protein KDK23_10670 [Leptospiraceae bacterium]|nr:hypothetical protein [Leptospiraceae bacterium]
MLTLVAVAGLCLAVIVFLNMLSPSALQPAGGELHKKRSGSNNEDPPRLDAKRVLKMEPGPQRPRICPVCGTLLGQTDYLFAALEPEPKTERKRQAHIYGCPYCLDQDGVVRKKKSTTEIEP